MPGPAVGPLTPNQLVSHNLARARKARGLTQFDLAERMEQLTGRPWSNASVSAAERAWKGGRARKFDANEIVALALALDVPVGYFLLAPDDSPKEFQVRITDDGVYEEDVPQEIFYPFDSFLRLLVGTVPWSGYEERMNYLFQKYLGARYEGPHELAEFKYPDVPLISGEGADEEGQKAVWKEAMEDVAKQAYMRALLTALAKAGAGDILREAQREFERRMEDLTKEANDLFQQAVDEAEAEAEEQPRRRTIRVKKKRKATEE